MENEANPVVDPFRAIRPPVPTLGEKDRITSISNYLSDSAMQILNGLIDEIIKKDDLSSDEKKKLIRDLLFIVVNEQGSSYYHKKPIPEAIGLREIYKKWLIDMHDPRLKAFTSLAYLTAGRVNEVNKIRPRDIEVSIVKDQEGNEHIVYIFKMINEKSRLYPFKYVPVVPKTIYENRFISYLVDYVDGYPDGKPIIPAGRKAIHKWMAYHVKEGPVVRYVRFKLKYNKREGKIDIKREMFEKELKWYPHYLRACRLTHLAPLGEYALMMIAGWSTPKPASYYVRFNWSMMVERLISTPLLGSSKFGLNTISLVDVRNGDSTSRTIELGSKR